MSHLGFRLLHAELLAQPEVEIQRAFLPWPDLQTMLVDRGLPLFTLEGQEPLFLFDVLGFSLQYELALPAFLRMLDLAHIPRRTEHRLASPDRWPFILVGGVGALNPEPIAPFVDAVFVGEADQAIFDIVHCLTTQKHNSRESLVGELSQLPGIYLPELVEAHYDNDDISVIVKARFPAQLPIVRQYVSNFRDLDHPSPYLVPLCSPIHDRVAIEVQRGCSQGCRFCQAGYVTRPTRQRDPQRILTLAQELIAQTGYEDLSLLSLSAGDYPCLQELLITLLHDMGPTRTAISLPSLRTETLHPQLAKQLAQIRKTGFTLAPEAATDRLRRVINKGNTEDNLLRSMESVMAAGYAQIKLYFMIGLPTETDDDVLAIARLMRRALREMTAIKRAARLTVSISTFVPKPHTPFQWEAMSTLSEIQHKQQLLLHHAPRRVHLKWHDPGQSLVEAYLARGDRRLAAVLDRLVTADYYGLDAWTDHFCFERWEQALRAACDAGEIPDPARWLAARDPDLPLPWEHISVGVERAYLLQERQGARAEKTRPDCSTGDCDHCGVCPDEPLHELAPTYLAPPEIRMAVDEGAATQPCLPQPFFLRLWFQKLDPASLLSHLEMMGAFARAARRARLPLTYSAGYHPKPKLRFSPALPLGAESRCEFLELSLQHPLSPQCVQHALAPELPDGLVLERCEHHERSLLPLVRGVCWRFELHQPLPEPSLLRAREKLAQGSLCCERRGKKRIDLSHLLLTLELISPTIFEVHCRFAEQGTARPAEILRALFEADAPCISRVRIIRQRWTFAEASRGPEQRHGQEQEHEQGLGQDAGCPPGKD